MGEFQFGHINTYARKPKAGKNGAARSVREILGEADRVAENSAHVTDPKPPVHLAGMTPSELAERIDDLLVERAIEGRRAPRSDVRVLAAAVYSWPEHVAYYDKDRLDAWVKDQIKWHAKYVGAVDCAVLHLDEAHPHIHVYTVDPDARRLTPGCKAKREAEAEGLAAMLPQKDICKQANIAYKAAMVAWQDALHAEVGQFHGLARLGPKRQRLTRPEWRKAKEERIAAADALNATRKHLHGLDIAARLEDFCFDHQRQGNESKLKQQRGELDALKAEKDALESERAVLEGEIQGLEFDARMSRDAVKRLQQEIELLEKRRDELRDSGGHAAPAGKPTPPKRGGPSFNP